MKYLIVLCMLFSGCAYNYAPVQVQQPEPDQTLYRFSKFNESVADVVSASFPLIYSIQAFHR